MTQALYANMNNKTIKIKKKKHPKKKKKRKERVFLSPVTGEEI
jgi:hypothetical protein